MCFEQCPTVSRKLAGSGHRKQNVELPPSSTSGGPWGGVLSPPPGGHPCKLPCIMPSLLTQRYSEHDAIQYSLRVGIKLLLQVCRGAPVLTLKYMIQKLGAFISMYSDFSHSVCAKRHKSVVYYSNFIVFHVLLFKTKDDFRSLNAQIRVWKTFILLHGRLFSFKSENRRPGHWRGGK